MSNTSVTRRLFTSCYLMIAATLGACGGGGGGAGGGVPMPVPPAITSQPAAASVADGGTASFSVSATGDSPLSYQWQRNAAALANGAGITGATSNALTITAPFAFNGSQISVTVTNAAGKIVSNAALLNVSAVAPSITQQPANASVAAGAPATFTVKTTGGTSPVTYQWKRDGTLIAGATAASFTLAAAAIGDNASTFAVDVINPAGTMASNAASLTVTAPSKSWGPAVLISSGDALRKPGYAQTVMDSAGNAFAVWREGTAANGRNAVWASRYPAGGAWSAAVTIDNGVGNALPPQIAITPGGVAVAAFSQSNSGPTVDALASRFDTAWGSVQTVNSSAGTNAVDAQVAVAPDGAATIVFVQSDGVGPRARVNNSNAAGAWGGPSIVGGQFAFTPQVAVAANGQAVMAWKQVTGAGGLKSAFWASRNVGVGWSTPVQLSAISGNLGSIQVAADAVGNAIAVWQDASGARQAAVFASRLDAISGSWSAAQTLNDGTNNAFLPEIAVDATGTMLAVWFEASDAAQAIGFVDIGVVANRFVAASGAWSGATLVQPHGAPAGQLPNVAVDAAGNAIAVWLQPSVGNGTHYELWSAPFTAAGAVWGTPLKLMTDAAAYAQIGTDQVPKIAVNSNGDAVVVWFEQTDAPFAQGIWTRVYR